MKLTNVEVKQHDRHSTARLDSASKRSSKGMRKKRKAQNKKVLNRMVQRADSFRNDAVEPPSGYHLARDLEYIYDEVMEEEFPAPDGFQKFPLDQSVPPGARTHTVRRVNKQGDARVYRGNTDKTGSASLTQDEESFQIRHYVTEIQLDFFEEMADGFAQSSIRSNLEEAAQDALLRLADEAIWNGLPKDGIPGVLDYVHMPKRYPGVAFNDNTSAKQMKETLHAIAQTPGNISKSVFQPDTMLVSDRLARTLNSTDFGDSSGDSVADRFLKHEPQINQIESTYRLQGIDGDGYDGILFYRDNRRAIANVVPQTPRMLPMEEDGFDISIPVYMTHGGVIMRKPLNNVLAVVKAVE
jgi:hypothetical protein